MKADKDLQKGKGPYLQLPGISIKRGKHNIRGMRIKENSPTKCRIAVANGRILAEITISSLPSTKNPSIVCPFLTRLELSSRKIQYDMLVSISSKTFWDFKITLTDPVTFLLGLQKFCYINSYHHLEKSGHNQDDWRIDRDILDTVKERLPRKD